MQYEHEIAEVAEIQEVPTVSKVLSDLSVLLFQFPHSFPRRIL
jgi:hypothetical protein